MAIEIAGISLPRIHRMVTDEHADFISHRIPGLDGNVVQDIGRHSVRLNIEGIFYGTNAKDDLESLRDVYKSRKPVDFLADIVGQAYFSQIIVERMEVRQAAEEPDQFSYRLIIAEYVPPPQPAAGFDVPDIDAGLELKALDFLSAIQLPDLLSVPGFGDPTEPLQSILDGVGNTLNGLTEPANNLAGLYGDSGSSNKSLKAAGNSGGSLFSSLKTKVNDNQILQLIQGQLSKLLSAGKTSGDTQQQTSGAIGSLQNQISGLLPPNINRTDILEQGFNVIKNLLPSQASDILGDLPGGIDSLFASLQTNLVDRLGALLKNFDSLSSLGISITSSQVTTEAALHTKSVKELSGSPLKTILRPSRTTRDVSSVLDPLNALLNLLPNPFDTKALLQLLANQLNQLPRESLPIQNLPVLDELRDKLNTVLGWLNQNSAALSASLTNSTQAIEVYIRSAIFDNGLSPVKTRLETLEKRINLTKLQASIDDVNAGLANLVSLVNGGNLSTADDTVTTLSGHIGVLRTSGADVMNYWMNEEGNQLVAGLSLLEDRLEERMADIMLLAAPATDLKIVGLLLKPLNTVLGPAGISAFIGGIHSLFNLVDNLVSKLNITQIAGTVQEVVDEAVGAVHTLQELLVNVTVEFSALVNRIKQAINNIGISQLVDELRQVLEQFENTVVHGLGALFSPVRQALLTAFDTINNLVAEFDPRAILQSVLDLIKALTDLLSNPVLIDTIHRLKGILGDVNNELGSFSFRSVTDVVIEGIGVVKDAFDIIAKIPMTDSIREEVSKALNAIPESIRPATETINKGLEEIVESGAKPVLVAIKDKPAGLVAEVKKYSPDKYLGDQLSAPYEAFVEKLEELKPTTLMQPVSDKLDQFLDQVRNTADPDKVFSLLQDPFNTLYNALDSLNPAALTQPLQKKLSEGIHLITDNLPLDAADAVFDQVDKITSVIKKAIVDAEGVRDAMIAINGRFAGLGTANNQLQQLGNEIITNLNTVSDFSGISDALKNLEQTIDDIQNLPLQQYFFPPMDNLIAQLTALNPQNRLIGMVQAQRGFPLAALNALPDSPQKTAVLNLLSDFNPMADEFSLPLGGLQDRLNDLKQTRTRLAAFFTAWQSRYHQLNGPLSQFRQKNLTLAELKTMLADTIQKQLSETLAPAFLIVEKFQLLLSTLLGEITDLISKLETQMAGLAQVGTALEKMRQGIHDLVDTLNSLDITFIAKEIEDIFSAVKAQLDAVNPQNISNLLKTTFNHLLDALEPNTLLGLTDLDASHKTLLDLLKERDPKVLLTDTVQPEFDKILIFLNEFDISELLNTFLQRIEDLKTQLEAELDRTADAYEGMVKTIPGDLQGELGVSVSVSA